MRAGSGGGGGPPLLGPGGAGGNGGETAAERRRRLARERQRRHREKLRSQASSRAAVAAAAAATAAAAVTVGAADETPAALEPAHILPGPAAPVVPPVPAHRPSLSVLSVPLSSAALGRQYGHQGPVEAKGVASRTSTSESGLEHKRRLARERQRRRRRRLRGLPEEEEPEPETGGPKDGERVWKQRRLAPANGPETQELAPPGGPGLGEKVPPSQQHMPPITASLAPKEPKTKPLAPMPTQLPPPPSTAAMPPHPAVHPPQVPPIVVSQGQLLQSPQSLSRGLGEPAGAGPPLSETPEERKRRLARERQRRHRERLRAQAGLPPSKPRPTKVPVVDSTYGMNVAENMGGVVFTGIGSRGNLVYPGVDGMQAVTGTSPTSPGGWQGQRHGSQVGGSERKLWNREERWPENNSQGRWSELLGAGLVGWEVFGSEALAERAVANATTAFKSQLDGLTPEKRAHAFQYGVLRLMESDSVLRQLLLR